MSTAYFEQQEALNDRPPLQDLPYVEDINGELEIVTQCNISTLGVSGETIRIFQGGDRGVMADSGANSCMADTETHLIGCHDIKPITLGLALKLDEEIQQFKCSMCWETKLTGLPSIKDTYRC